MLKLKPLMLIFLTFTIKKRQSYYIKILNINNISFNQQHKKSLSDNFRKAMIYYDENLLHQFAIQIKLLG